MILDITDGDRKLKFRIDKMPALTAERWLMQAFTVIGSGADTLDDMTQSDLLRAISKAKFGDAKTLADELLLYVYRIDKNGTEQQMDVNENAEIINSFVTDPMTLLKLRLESAKLNFGRFFNKNPADLPDGTNISQTAPKSEE